ncbi:MAG: hypothetical protein PHX08_22015 [Lachnospiraceae bacterium]|nr:hypothetical protein [Lachnospiraceae bacterium]
MGIRIGSLNMCNFNFRSEGCNKKNFIRIANIISSEQFDIVALQEVLSEQALNVLLKALGSNWDKAWMKPNKSSSYASKGFAFIWNKKKIHPVTTKKSYGVRVFEPEIINQYRLNRSVGQQELARNPYYARFTTDGLPGGAFFEIRLINVHIMFKKGVTVVSDLNDSRMRNNEYNVLMEAIYPKISDRCYGNFMPAYTVILGDYNMNLKRDWTVGQGRSSVYIDNEVIFISDGNETKQIKTVQDELTTLKDPQNQENETDNNPLRGYANNYDHFSYDVIRFSNANVSYRRVDAVRKYFNDNFEEYRREVSDHIPIAIDIELR